MFGIGARFVNLDKKFYTNDEATASLHVAGHTIADYAAVVFDGRPRTVAQLLAFQRADATTTVADVVRSLAVEDPQHPPLFYLAERGWTALAGSSVAARRSLSALFGTLAVAATGWLAWELFGTAGSALACAALVAISPFHVLYAQQTREYSLWTLLLACASALLLAALRSAAPLLWVAYAACLALGLYADTFFLGTLVTHAIYV
ncbi:MAG: glycosyltransferase family 39 protein, partial [Candidatus Eremiobacteraeota bacterium]|nr:glycosyltransferase family 39 protein [Candidatus Eremiobacteraeota bacterium]